MEYEVVKAGGYQVLVVYRTIDHYNVNEFKKLFYEMLDGRYQYVAIELKGNANEMSSSIIGALVTAQKKFSALKGKLVLVNISEPVHNVLHVAGLSDFFNFADSIDDLV